MKTKKIKERDLLKALNELEELVEKGGDALQDADANGEFATEGEDLSEKKAAKYAKGGGREDLTKMMSASDSDSEDAASSDDDSSDGASDDDSDDAGSDDASSPMAAPPAKGKTKKAMRAASSSDDDSSSDDSSSNDYSKSFRQAATDNETVNKAVEVSDFLEAMVDEVGHHLDGTRRVLAKSFAKMLGQAVDMMVQHVDSRLAQVQGAQGDFNRRMAKAVAAIGNSVNEQEDLLKSFSDRPAGGARGKAVLSKSEIAQPPLGQSAQHQLAGGSDGGVDDEVAQLSEVPISKIFDWMFAKAMTQQIDPLTISQFEADKNLGALHPTVRKALINDLCK